MRVGNETFIFISAFYHSDAQCVWMGAFEIPRLAHSGVHTLNYWECFYDQIDEPQKE